MSYQRSQTPTTAPQQAPFAPTQAPTFSPLLGLQGLIGNAGVLDLLRPQMPGAQSNAGPSPLVGALQTVLQRDATAPTPPPGGTEAPSTAVAATLADEGQTAALTRAPSSPATSAAAQVTALDETQGGVEGAITDSRALTTAVAAELGTTPSDVTAQAQDTWQPSWWDKAVDATVGGVGSLVDGGVDLLSDVPVLGTAAATMAPVTKFAWETLGGFAKGAGDFVGGLGHMAAHPLDTLSGLATMAEHIPGSPLKPLHKLYDVATTDKTLEETFWRNPLDVAKEDLSADWDFWKGVGGALLDPYERSVEQGKYGEALGRGIFDIGGLFVGASEAKAASKGAEVVNVLEHASVLNKVDDSVKIASRANEIGAVTDDLVRAGGKADDVTKAASDVDEAADLSKTDDATKVADRAEDAALPLSSKDESMKAAPATQESGPVVVDDLQQPPAQMEAHTSGQAEEAGTIQGQVDEKIKAQDDAVTVTDDAARLAELEGIDPQAIEQAQALGMQISSKKFDSIAEQAVYLAENVQGLTVEQAQYLLEMSTSRQGTVVFGGSRVRGAARLDEAGNVISDLDVGFKGLTPGQINKTMNGFNKQFTGSSQGPGRIIEHNWIYPGSKPKRIAPIESPEEFFMRSGVRDTDPLAGPRAGEAFGPSGFIAVTPDGRIVIVR